uniref:Exocyst subunit Exo70 family protein n=2 Tax=Aegilops tauschii subsp. strangulata TaxID=200361 RepID=A0A452XG77_AEGTS
GRLAAVPEESMGCSTAAYPPRGVYLDWIRTVAVSGAQIRSTTLSHSHSHSDYSGSSYSSASNSHLSSNNSGCSSGSASAVTFGGQEELKRIARLMVSDGYTQRMVQAFHATSLAQGLGNGGDPDTDSVLETWFSDLDVGWVLETCQEHGSLQQLQLQDQSASFLQDLVERWIRGLTITLQSILEMVSTRHEMVAVARFGKASISKMLVFVDAFLLSDVKAEKLQAVLDMYICVSRASYMFTLDVMSAEAQGMFNETSGSLRSGRDRLKDAVFSGTMEEMSKVMDDGDDGLWAIEIKHGGGGIHKNTRLGVGFIMSLFKAAGGHNSQKRPVYLGGLVNDMIHYLMDLLCRKSELCTDLSLRYLFLLNNSHFVMQECDSFFSFDTMLLVWPERLATLCEPTSELAPDLTSECNRYMASYLDASWGHVLSSIPRSHFPGPIHRWIYTSSLTKFESAFHQTCQAQKFWKVPDPGLRDVLRRVITERVISSYRDYLKEHPELAEHVNRGSTSPDVLEGLLGELFQG